MNHSVTPLLVTWLLCFVTIVFIDDSSNEAKWFRFLLFTVASACIYFVGVMLGEYLTLQSLLNQQERVKHENAKSNWNGEGG